ncbi:MAG: transposase [Phycisphaeraceae bacterium]|nr:transposase [Phycisphaeraceae bacterium]
MGRAVRIDVGGYAYHVLNRGNGQMTLFADGGDFAAFDAVLEEAAEKFPNVRIVAYCLMPNHWHLVLWPTDDGDLSRFVGWVTLTHTQRWHAHRGTSGRGHVYQGRYRSFLVETERYLATVCRYTERNAARAGLVDQAEAWRWSSLWRWHYGDAASKKLLSPWPTPSGRRPSNWLRLVNQPLTEDELEAIRTASQRGRPFGSQNWQARVTKQFGLDSCFRPRGRPKKGS